jgi:tetratricopeptide (TPR) repeat protein
MSTPSDSNQASVSPSIPPVGQPLQQDVARRVKWLADELAVADSKEQQALVAFECAVLREQGRDEAGAAKDYLAAYNADPGFREPVEALASLLERRKSFKNLGRLLDALARAASSSEQTARSQLLRGQYLLEHQNDAVGARAAFEQAVEEDPQSTAGWYELELVAAKATDPSLRARALEQRMLLCDQPEWKALLLVDLARLVHQDGDFERALGHLREAANLPSPARMRALQAIEAAARLEGRDELVAEALETQASLVRAAIDDDKAAEQTGVPLRSCNAATVADLLWRASDARRRAGDAQGAMALLARAADTLPQDVALAYARLRAAEALGDVDSAAAMARTLLEGSASGRTAASLWMRVFEAAAARGERDRALEALSAALAADPACIPARALQIDLLVDGDPATFAASLEAMAAEGLSDEAKGRAYLVSAWAWSAKARDVQGAKAALSQAAMFGVAPGVVARVARALAALVQDDAWYEEGTRRLLAAGASQQEHVSLWWELVRLRMLRSDDDGAAKAAESLASAPGGAWLGRALAAYALGLTRSEQPAPARRPRAPELLEQLARVEPDPEIARALGIVAVVRRARAGDTVAAREKLRELHRADPADLVAAVMLADLERGAGETKSAAHVLGACAAAAEDKQAAAALHLEAGLLLWRAGDRRRGLDAVAAAHALFPEAATSALLWATAALDPDSLEGRRRTLELSADAGSDKIVAAIERLAVESSPGGDLGQARAALDALDLEALGELGVAGWLARLIYAGSAEDRAERARALDNLETLGLKASAVVAAERYRIARTEDADRDKARDHAQAWALADGGVGPALEWLAAGRAAEDRESEVKALRLAARQLPAPSRAALLSAASLLELLHAPAAEHPPLVEDTEACERLMNLELAPSGCDPRRRAAALLGLGDALGEPVRIDALALAGWSRLASGDAAAAAAAFREVTQERADDLAAWEGLRAAAEAQHDVALEASACARLGELCVVPSRAAAFFETAGLLWIDKAGDPERGERALEACFERDPSRATCFDRLFRRVRGREDNDHLLALIARRLEVADQTPEIAKLFWEQARVLRQKGDFEGAMASLENVTMLEPDHVGALALSGEIHIRRGAFADAVDSLARLAAHDGAPSQQRLVSGMAAVDLCENKLGDHARALEVLLGLHRAGLSTLPVRERLARAAAHTSSWAEATSALEILMAERPTPEGRIEAARLAMVIYRDKIGDAAAADRAVTRLLDESTADPEALDLLLLNPQLGERAARTRMLERARRSIVGGLGVRTLSPDKVDMLARIAAGLHDQPLRQAALGALVALGRGSPELERELAGLAARGAHSPQVAIDDAAVEAIGDPRDTGPIPQLIRAVAEVVTEALGPTLAGLGATKKDRVDARDGLPLRNEIAHWAGALGIGDFELYVGGRDPAAVVGVPGDPPLLVVGRDIGMPLRPEHTQALARELFALRRGISVVRARDEATVACVIVAVCNACRVPMPSPNYAMLAEVQRLVSKAMPRKLRNSLPDLCAAVARSELGPRDWVAFALSSLDRMAAIAAGDVALVLSDVLGVPRDRLAEACADHARARALLSFVLSEPYLDLRRRLGMGIQ